MLFMTIYSYEPEKRDLVIKRRMEKGDLVPKGVKTLGEWSAVAGGKVFRLVETNDAASALAAIRAWSDLGKLELIPIIVTEEALKVSTRAH
jgi:hypothetical protein